MIGTALTLAALTTGGFLAIFYKLPVRLKKFIIKHPLTTDITTLGVAYLILGGTLTALMAAAMSGLFVSALLFFAKNQERYRYDNSCNLDS